MTDRDQALAEAHADGASTLPAHLRPWGGTHELRGWKVRRWEAPPGSDGASFRLDSPNGVTILVVDRREAADATQVERAAREAAWVMDGNPWERGAPRA